jgi:hypothetical protein
MRHLRLCAVVLGLALSAIPCGLSQTPAGSSIPPLPTNLPRVKAFVAPPPTFNPVVAPPEALQQYGFPPKPDQLKAPAAYSAWSRAVSSPQTRLQSPQLVQTEIFHRPAQHIQPSKAPKAPANELKAIPANAVAITSSNWSGYLDYDNVTKPFANSYIYASWTIPVAQHAFGHGLPPGWDYSAQWVGIDGYESPDVLQAGTEADAYLMNSTQASFYAAWVEWYPSSEFQISNFAVAPGNEVFVEVWNTGATVGNAYLINITTQQSVAFTFDAPSGTTLVGNSAEWVVERPAISNDSGGLTLAPLTNYVSCPFDSCYAFGSVNGGTYNVEYYPGINLAGTTVFAISMLDDAGGVISVPSLVGPADLWFRDTGSAFSN